MPGAVARVHVAKHGGSVRHPGVTHERHRVRPPAKITPSHYSVAFFRTRPNGFVAHHSHFFNVQPVETVQVLRDTHRRNPALDADVARQTEPVRV